MHLVYIDDSGDEQFYCFSALIIPADGWLASFEHLRGARTMTRDSDGVFMKKELHSTEWNAGRGRIAKRTIGKRRRVSLYNFFLSSIAMLPNAELINACVPKADEQRGFQFLLQRIENNMSRKHSKCIIFSDEGKNYDSIRRKLARFNQIPSQFGAWADGRTSKSIPATSIVEDIFYRDSAKSMFIQAADACAYALLRFERPLASKSALGLDQSFEILDRILVKRAFGKDPKGLGIIR